MKRWILFLLGALVIATGVWGFHFGRIYNSKFPLITQVLADMGDNESQRTLGLLYQLYAVETDESSYDEKAYYWYERAVPHVDALEALVKLSSRMGNESATDAWAEKIVKRLSQEESIRKALSYGPEGSFGLAGQAYASALKDEGYLAADYLMGTHYYAQLNMGPDRLEKAAKAFDQASFPPNVLENLRKENVDPQIIEAVMWYVSQK